MAPFNLFLLCTKEEMIFLPVCLRLLRKNLKPTPEGVFLLGSRDDKLDRLAYDMGATHKIINLESGWEKIADTITALTGTLRALIWWPRALLLKGWSLPGGENPAVWGEGFGLYLTSARVKTVLTSFSNPPKPGELNASGSGVQTLKTRLKVLPASLFSSWDQQISLTEGWFLEGLTFQDWVQG